MCTAILNYCLYLLSNNSFILSENGSIFETAFEFVFYSFSLLLTYSTNSIIPHGILSKSLQMIEISYSFIFIGIVLIKLIDSIISHKKEQN